MVFGDFDDAQLILQINYATVEFMFVTYICSF